MKCVTCVKILTLEPSRLYPLHYGDRPMSRGVGGRGQSWVSSELNMFLKYPSWAQRGQAMNILRMESSEKTLKSIAQGGSHLFLRVWVKV